MCSHHRPHDAAFSAPIGTNRHNVDQHAVAMHGVADGVGRDEDISCQPRFKRRTQRTRVGDDEAKAVAVHAEASNDKVLVRGGLRQGVAIGIKLNQFARSDQLLKMRVEVSAGVAMQAEFAHQLLESGGTLRLAGDVFQDGRVGKHAEGVSYQPLRLTPQGRLRSALRITEGLETVQRTADESSLLPRVPAAAWRPHAERAPDHRDLAGMITVVSHRLPEHSLKRSREFRIAVVHRFKLALHFFQRGFRQHYEISEQAGKAFP